MNKLPPFIYVFDCPYHGNEDQVFCFRASQSELKNRWHKFIVEYQETPFDNDTEELKLLLEKMMRR